MGLNGFFFNLFKWLLCYLNKTVNWDSFFFSDSKWPKQSITIRSSKATDSCFWTGKGFHELQGRNI